MAICGPHRNYGVFRIREVLEVVIAMALVLTFGANARAATITVDSLADPGAPGICVLRDAITAANTMTATNGCVAGSGNDTIKFGVTGTIMLGSTLPTIANVAPNSLIINGRGQNITISGNNTGRVMTVNSGATLNIQNLTITNGATLDYGGGIYNLGTLSVTNCTISDNNGGGIWSSGTLTVTNSTISDNYNNEIPNGGGIQNEHGGVVIVNNTIISGNINDGAGGGIDNNATMTLTNSTIAHNDNVTGNGGGIDNSGGTLTVANSTFSHNTAGEAGGIFSGGTLTITNSTFSDNSANLGGGIWNSEQNGGGHIGVLTVTNSTFSGNSGFEGGNSIYNSVGTVTVKSTILANSIGGNCTGTIIDGGFNIADDSSCSFTTTTSRNSTDPQLDPAGLANNGGPTQTIALQATSPAIDAIPLVDCTDQASPRNPIVTDQRLFPRPDSAETNCDIGAYEYQDTAFIPFSQFGAGLTIDSNTKAYYVNSPFTLGDGGSIDPITQPAAFSVGSYVIRLPVGSFVQQNNGYVYQKWIKGVFLRLIIEPTSTAGQYDLHVEGRGVTPATSGPVPVTLIIGNNGGSRLMNGKFD